MPSPLVTWLLGSPGSSTHLERTSPSLPDHARGGIRPVPARRAARPRGPVRLRREGGARGPDAAGLGEVGWWVRHVRADAEETAEQGARPGVRPRSARSLTTYGRGWPHRPILGLGSPSPRPSRRAAWPSPAAGPITGRSVGRSAGPNAGRATARRRRGPPRRVRPPGPALSTLSTVPARRAARSAESPRRPAPPRPLRTRAPPRARDDRRPGTGRRPRVGRLPALRARDHRPRARRRGPGVGLRRRWRRAVDVLVAAVLLLSLATLTCRARRWQPAVPPETMWLLAAALTPVLIARRVLQHTVVTVPDDHGLGRCLPPDRRGLCIPLPDHRRVHLDPVLR